MVPQHNQIFLGWEPNISTSLNKTQLLPMKYKREWAWLNIITNCGALQKSESPGSDTRINASECHEFVPNPIKEHLSTAHCG